jgi:hypothetical protein
MKKDSAATLFKTEQSFSVYSESDSLANRVLFFGIIQFNKDSSNYFRSYMKIQELAAQVGGIIKIIYLIFGYFIDKISDRYFKNEMINEFIDYKTSDFQNIKSINNESRGILIGNSVEKDNIIIQNQQHILGNNRSSMNQASSINKISSSWARYQQQIKLPKRENYEICKILKACSCCLSKLDQKAKLHHDMMKALIIEKLDVTYYLMIVNQFEKIKALLFNECIRYSIEMNKKIVYSNTDFDIIPEKKEEINANLEKECKVINYFISKYANNSLNEQDIAAFEFLDPAIKSFINLQ